MMNRVFGCLMMLTFVVIPVFSQVPRQDWVDQVAQPAVGPLPLLRSRSNSVETNSDWTKPDFRLFETVSRVSYQILPPAQGNDGAAWEGKGFNARLNGGGRLTWGAFSLTLEPQLSWAQNEDITLLPSAFSGGYGDYWRGLDRLQRYGNKALYHWDWGNSEVRAVWNNMTLGFGTEALWLGAADHNSVLLSDNAGGFPHLDFGTQKPWQTPVGAFEVKGLWGALYNSDTYQTGGWNLGADTRFFHGLVASWTPSFLSTLKLGAGRVFYSPWTTLSWWKAFQSVSDTVWKDDRGENLNGVKGDDDVDQMIALYFEYTIRDQGFHLYGEIARNDHASDFTDFMTQPDHSLGYVVGVKQIVPLVEGWSLYGQYEQADLGLNIGTVLRPTGSWYRRGYGEAGYTLGGQVLGASIGPGSNSQDFEVGFVKDDLSLGFVFQRVANDVDYLILVVPKSTFYSRLPYEINMYMGVKSSLHWQDWKVTFDAGKLQQYGRHWMYLNGHYGLSASVLVTWRGF